MPTMEKTQAEILAEAAREAAGAAPVVKSLLESAAYALQRGDTAEAQKLLAPTITCLNFISQIISTLEQNAGDRLAEIKLDGQNIVAVQSRWIKRLEELKNSIGANDMVRTADLLAYEISREFDCQVDILKRLAEGHA